GRARGFDALARGSRLNLAFPFRKGTLRMLTSRKRLWGMSALLALVLASPGRTAELDRYVPGDAEQVVVINIKQLLDAPLIKKHALPEIEKQIERNKDLQQLQKLTGLDPLKDLTSVV